MKTERRFIDVKEIRADEEGMFIEGYPIVYNSVTEIAGMFRERIDPGAAAEALRESDEILLFNHDSNFPLARRSNGTLEAVEDEKGVKIRADLSGSARGREAHEMIKNGLITKMSFSFTVREQSWETAGKGELDLRVIKKFERIYDYSPVTFPAYQATEVLARSAEQVLQNEREPSPEEERTSPEEEFDPSVLEPYELELNYLIGENNHG
jgi:uncharacterized protein